MNLQTPQDIDLTACEREPIHIPGSIQPHGLLVAIRLSDRTIAYASVNIAETFGLEPADALDRPFDQALPVLSAEFAAQLDDPPSLGSAGFVRTIQVRTAQREKLFEAAISRSGDCAILELEEPPFGSASSLDALYPTLRRFVEQLQGASTLEVLCHLVAQDIRCMTGFDRVLIYRFDEQWNGTVIAEDRNAVLPSYLDLRFPASDIPAQARELYRRNRLRIIPDANYMPVPIQSRDPAPLDLSDSVLRSVSPVHLEYMRNMGTLASMSISILRGGKLWPDLLPQQGAEAGLAPGAQRLRLPHADLLAAARSAGEHDACREPCAPRRRADKASRAYGGRGAFQRGPREPSGRPDDAGRCKRSSRPDAGPLLVPGRNT